MPRYIDRTLLSAELQADLAASKITNGQYPRLIPTFSDAALCDHAEVYALHCEANGLTRYNPSPAARLHHRILPELVARLWHNAHAVEFEPSNPNSIFRRSKKVDWERVDKETEGAIADQRALAAMSDAELAVEAETTRTQTDCRWEPQDPVYEATIYHIIIPEICRLATREPACA